MKRKPKKVFAWLSSIYELFKITYFSLTRENRINYLEHRTQTRRVSVLANGPSLRHVRFSLDGTMDFCTVNDSPLDEIFFAVRPQYHVLIDPLYFEEDQSLLMEAFRQVDWEMTLLFPYRFRREATALFGGNPHILLVPIHCNEVSDTFLFRKIAYKMFKKGIAMPSPQNVLIPSIFCMMNAGYQHIDLYGADHSWLQCMAVNSKNEVCLVDHHFYDKEQVLQVPWKKTNGVVYQMSEILRDLAKTFAAYHFLQEYAEYLGNVTIINYTKDSFIDAFPRR